MSLLLFECAALPGKISFFVNGFNCSVAGNVMIGFRATKLCSALDLVEPDRRSSEAKGSGIYALAAFRPTLYASLITHVRRK